MGLFVIRLDDCFLTWSTVLDAPVTLGTPDKMQAALDYQAVSYNPRYADPPMHLSDALYAVHEADAQCDLAWEHHVLTPDGALRLQQFNVVPNRAGPGESNLDYEELYERYCTNYSPSPARKNVEDYTPPDETTDNYRVVMLSTLPPGTKVVEVFLGEQHTFEVVGVEPTEHGEVVKVVDERGRTRLLPGDALASYAPPPAKHYNDRTKMMVYIISEPEMGLPPKEATLLHLVDVATRSLLRRS